VSGFLLSHPQGRLRPAPSTARELTEALDRLAQAGTQTALRHDWSPTKASPARATWASVNGGINQETNEADRLTLLLVRATLDHIRSIHTTVGMPYTPLVLGRAALENAIRASYLLEAPDNRERVRRRLNAYVAGRYEGRNIRQAVDNTGYQDDQPDETEQHIQAELEKARSYKFNIITVNPKDRIRRREWIEEAPMSILALSRMYDEEMPQGYGPIFWQLLSGVAHGHEYGMMMRGKKMPAPNGTGDIMAAVPADGPRLAMDLCMVPIALIRLMKGCIMRFGWDTDLLLPATIDLLPLWWTAGTLAKSSKQEREELAAATGRRGRSSTR